MINLRKLTFIPLFQAATTGKKGLFPLINCGGDPCDLSNFNDLLVALLKFLWGFSTTVAVLVVFYAAFQFITAGGDPAKVESARKTLIAGLFGLIIVAIAWAAVTLFARLLYGGNIPGVPGINLK